MKKQLLKNVSCYSAMAAATLGIQSAAFSQVVYHDVVPDDTLTIVGLDGEYYGLDLNNDGIFDFNIAADLIYFEDAIMIGKNHESNMNSVLGVYSNVGEPAYNVFQLQANDPIGPSSNWVRPSFPKDEYFGNLLFAYDSSDYGYWKNGVVDGYIGLRLRDGTDKFYGWLRCDVAADASQIIIKDYAYNSLESAPILAGDMGCADNYEPNDSRSQAAPIAVNTPVHGLILSSADKDWFSFPVTAAENNLRVVLSNLPANYNIRLTDQAGIQIASSLHKGKNNDSIVYNNLTAGIYYVVVLPKNINFSATKCYALVAETSANPFRESLSQASDQNGLEVNVFPNPFSSATSIQFSLEESCDLKIELMDLSGRTIRTIADENFVAGSHLVVLEKENLSSGIYFLKTKINSTSSIQKLIVQ